ncbi:MAG: helix-turn-helix transcriptional regulator [Clostridia bacterium]|nr:helix-turn-helix transcriptional regulator [Clostridia bacterium]
MQHDYMKVLRSLREDNDLTQEQVAKVIGTSQTMYARYERCANELPIRHLLALCEFYNVSADYVLNVKTDKRRTIGKAKDRN